MIIPGIMAQRRVSSGAPPFALSPSQRLLDSLMAWWDFEENDTTAFFTNQLSPRRSLQIEGASNTAARSTASGKIGRAMEVDAANESARLDAGVLDFNFANQSFTVFGWHWRGGGDVLDSNIVRYIGGRGAIASNQRSFNLLIRGNGVDHDYAAMLSSGGAAGTTTVVIGPTYDLSTGGWDFVAYGYDATAGEAFLIVNGSRFSATRSGGVYRDSTSRFGFGGSITQGGVSSFPQLGRHDLAGVINSAITDDEYAVLYNAGAGVGLGSISADSGVPYVAGRSDTLFTTATSQNATIPALAIEDDLLVACVMHRSALTPPAGWTLVDSVTFTSPGFTQISSVYTRPAAAGSGGASTTWTQAASGRISVTILAIKKAGAAAAINSSSTDSISDTGTNVLGIAGLTSTDSGQLLIAFSSTLLAATTATNTLDVSAGWHQDTPAYGSDTGHQIRVGVAHRRVIAPGAEAGSFTINTESSTNGWGSVTLLID